MCFVSTVGSYFKLHGRTVYTNFVDFSCLQIITLHESIFRLNKNLQRILNSILPSVYFSLSDRKNCNAFITLILQMNKGSRPLKIYRY